ncbi:MAG TPA: hypothetical protein VIV11_20800, partial [Kofleriaceae bacterium]
MRWALVLVTCIGCFAPSAQPGARCANGMCPEGLVCSPATDTCERTTVALDDAGGVDIVPLDDAPLATDDALPDAPPLPMAVLVQQANGFSANGGMVSATLPALPTSGNVLVMVGAAISGSLTSVTGGGATWTRATSSLINSNVEVWFGVTNGSSATVTVNRTLSISSIWLVVFEWQGLDATAPLDVARSANGIGM